MGVQILITRNEKYISMAALLFFFATPGIQTDMKQHDIEHAAIIKTCGSNNVYEQKYSSAELFQVSKTAAEREDGK